MTDTKMKTLGELAKELRAAGWIMNDLPDVAGKRMDEAADRLERIDKAWRTTTDTYEALRAAIEGEP